MLLMMIVGGIINDESEARKLWQTYYSNQIF